MLGVTMERVGRGLGLMVPEAREAGFRKDVEEDGKLAHLVGDLPKSVSTARQVGKIIFPR
jgi:hypothetical protein